MRSVHSPLPIVKKTQTILGIDASRSVHAAPTGVERYSTEIIRALIEKSPKEKIRLYTPQWLEAFPKKLQRRIWLPRLWTLLRLSWEMFFHAPDLLFVPSHGLPFFPPQRTYITIHDVAFERHPKAYKWSQRWYLKMITRRALKLAAGIFVPSILVKNDLIKLYGANKKKVHVIPHGRLPLQKVDAARIRDRLNYYQLNANEPLFFFVGRLETKKNLLVLMDAWAKVQQKHPKGRLFLGGMYGHGFNELFERMEDADLSGTILAPGYISEEDVAVLFHVATAMVLPSRDEGFGLPILQAFESNSAVICSDLPSLREVAGDAALYANPGKANDFAKHMIHLMEDKDLKKKLVEKGKKRLKEFSWEKAAQSILDVIHSDQ